VRGLAQINTHVDLIDWRGGRGFVGVEAALGALIAALVIARTQSGEPVGLLSHHLAMDEAAWDFLDLLMGKAAAMPEIEIQPAHELFASREARV
jgi:hypothetical protein